MKEILIDCTHIDGPRELHRVIAREMCFPDWYGDNLDALHDLLTAIAEDTELKLVHFDALPAFTNGFRRVLKDSEQENPHFHVTIL